MADDRDLYDAWVAGDRGAGAALIDRHLAAVSRFFANKTVATAEHDDLVAMTFERCAKSLGGWRGEGSFRGYLLGIAWNVLRDELRKRAPDPALGSISVADLGPSPSRIAAERDEVRLLLAGLRAIPLEYQLALELHFFEELSRDDAARVLGIPAGTVASRIRRGKELLAEAIERIAEAPSLALATTSGLETWARELRARLG